MDAIAEAICLFAGDFETNEVTPAIDRRWHGRVHVIGARPEQGVLRPSLNRLRVYLFADKREDVISPDIDIPHVERLEGKSRWHGVVEKNLVTDAFRLISIPRSLEPVKMPSSTTLRGSGCDPAGINCEIEIGFFLRSWVCLGKRWENLGDERQEGGKLCRP